MKRGEGEEVRGYGERGDRWLYFSHAADNGERDCWVFNSYENLENRNQWDANDEGLLCYEISYNAHYTNDALFPLNPWEIPSNHWMIRDTYNTVREEPNLKIELCESAAISAEQLERYKSIEESLDSIKLEYNRSQLLISDANKYTCNLFNGCKELYNRLNATEKENLIKNNIIFKTIFKNQNVCIHCFTVGLRKKCVHFDCPGVCSNCMKNTDKNEEACGACKRKPELQCPVCFETFNKKFLKILKCRHCICWKCQCSSHEAGKPIIKCPTCRAQI